MKITAVDTIRSGRYPNLCWVRVWSADGYGLGETFYGSGAVEAFIHETAAERLIGTEVDTLHPRTDGLVGYVGRTGSGAEVRGTSALDIALWDLAAKARGIPLHEAVSPDSSPTIPVYNTCAGPEYVKSLSHQDSANWGLGASHGSYEDLEATYSDAGLLARSLLDMGISAMKIWPFDRAAERNAGRSISNEELVESLNPIRKIREAVGEAMEIKVELHGLWSAPGIDRVLAALEEFSPAWVEDPIRVSDVWEGARLTAMTSYPIAVGETLAGVDAYRHLCERRAADIAICDVGWCGGVGTALEVSGLVESHGMGMALHDCTGPVGLAVATNLSCALDSVSIQEFVRAFYYGWYQDVVCGLPVFDTGSLTVSGVGHGADLVAGFAEREDVTVRRFDR